MTVIKGPAQKVGAHIAKGLPKLGGSPPGAGTAPPHLGPREPAAPAAKPNSPDKRRVDDGKR